MSARRSKIALDDHVDDSPAAKRRKHEANLKAAAQAAARRALANVTTVFFDDAHPPARPSEPAAAAASLPASVLGREGAQNGAASPISIFQEEPHSFPLVDYSHDASSDDDSSQDGHTQQQPDSSAALGPSSAAAIRPVAAAEAAAEPVDPSIDDELASFMNDLESSGLLGAEDASTQQPASSVAAGTPPASTATAANSPAAPAANASAQPAAASSAAGRSGADTGASSSVDAGGDGGDEQAEQRVLGPLLGRPDWTEVMDMGSRRVYFWNMDTDAVEWEPPAGGTPREAPEEQPAGGGEAGASTEEVVTTHSVPVSSAAQSPAMDSRPAQQSEAPAAGAQSGGADPATAPLLPSAGLARRTASLVERLRAAAGGLFAAAPKLVWLAIEAEIRAKDLQHMSDLQRAAAGTGTSTSNGVLWQQYEQHAEQQLAKLEAELPMATAEAAQLQAAAKAAAQYEVSEVGMATTAMSPRSEALVEDEPNLPPLPDQAPQPPSDEPAPPPDEQPALPPDDEAVPGHQSVTPDEQLSAPVPEGKAQDSLPLLSPAVNSLPAQEGGSVSSAAVNADHQQEPAAAACSRGTHAAAGDRVVAQQGGMALEEGELAAGDQLGSADGASPAAAPAATAADDSMDMDLDDIVQADAPAASTAAPAAPATAQPSAAPQPPAAPSAAVSAPLAATAAQPPATSAPTAAAASAATHPAAPVAWPMPIGGPMAMPFTWSFYYPPPGYPPMHAFSAAHGPHTLPHPAMFPPADALHLAHASAPPSATYGAAASPAAADAAAGPAAAEAAATPEPRRAYWAQPVRAQQANGTPDAEPSPPPLPDDGDPAPEPSAAPAGQAQAVRKAKAPVGLGVLSARKKAKSGKLQKGASSLIGKWQAVQQDLKAAEEAEQAAGEVAADPQALERKKLAEAEEWRMQQLRTGQAADNANFQPVSGDWRDKVKAARKEERRAKKAAKAPQSGAGVDLEALSATLPAGWRAMLDPSSNEIYYGNLSTKETSWERPT